MNDSVHTPGFTVTSLSKQFASLYIRMHFTYMGVNKFLSTFKGESVPFPDTGKLMDAFSEWMTEQGMLTELGLVEPKKVIGLMPLTFRK